MSFYDFCFRVYFRFRSFLLCFSNVALDVLVCLNLDVLNLYPGTWIGVWIRGRLT